MLPIRLFAAGALDVWTTPIQMKKQRPGTLLSVLARSVDEDRLADILLRETTTLGVRVHSVHRHEARRELRSVETEWGTVRVKFKFVDDELIGVKPEHDDCRQLATENNVSLQSVYESVQLTARQRWNGEEEIVN